MAKGYGLSGKIQGKLGSKVYRIEAGEQIISEYNPNKQDAKTEKQIIQRTKMLEANAVSKRFPWECIVGYSTNKSKARNAFVKDIIKNTVVTKNNDSYIGLVNLGDISLSNGVQVMYNSLSVTKFSVEGQQSINAQLRVPPNSPVFRFLFVTLYDDRTGNGLRMAQYNISAERNQSNICTASIVLNETGLITAGSCYSYAIPICVDNLDKRVIYGRFLNTSHNGDITAETLVSFARANMFAASLYAGRTDFD